MKQVECNKCGKMFEVEDNAEWGYCPFCENDNVEVFKNQLLNVQIVSSKEITKLHKELALIEKALELAVKELACNVGDGCKTCTRMLQRICPNNIDNCRSHIRDYFKTKAKEMMSDNDEQV